MTEYAISTTMARFRWLIASSAAVALLGAAACGFGTSESIIPSATPQPVTPTPTPLPSVEAASTSPSIDDRFAAIARDVPGFGAFFLAPPADPPTGYVYLTDPTIDLAPLKASMLRNLATYNPLNPDIQLVPLQGRYNWLQLKGWYDDAEGEIWKLGVTSTDIQEGANRLEYGVADENAIVAVTQRLRDLGVPDDAFEVYVQTPSKPR